MKEIDWSTWEKETEFGRVELGTIDMKSIVQPTSQTSGTKHHCEQWGGTRTEKTVKLTMTGQKSERVVQKCSERGGYMPTFQVKLKHGMGGRCLKLTENRTLVMLTAQMESRWMDGEDLRCRPLNLTREIQLAFLFCCFCHCHLICDFIFFLSSSKLGYLGSEMADLAHLRDEKQLSEMIKERFFLFRTLVLHIHLSACRIFLISVSIPGKLYSSKHKIHLFKRFNPSQLNFG